MKATITIQAVKPPREGQKSGCITTTTNEKYWLWATKLGMAKVGMTYDVTFEENNGFNNIKTMTQVEGAAAASASRPASAPADHTSEQIFVVALLKSLIESGQVKNDKAQLWATTQMLRGLYKHTFGFEAMQQHMEAAE